MKGEMKEQMRYKMERERERRTGGKRKHLDRKGKGKKRRGKSGRQKREKVYLASLFLTKFPNYWHNVSQLHGKYSTLPHMGCERFADKTFCWQTCCQQTLSVSLPTLVGRFANEFWTFWQQPPRRFAEKWNTIWSILHQMYYRAICPQLLLPRLLAYITLDGWITYTVSCDLCLSFDM